MKNNKIRIFSLAAILVLYAICCAAEDTVIPDAREDMQILPLTLDEVLKIAIINNFDIQLAKYDRAIKDADMDDTLSIYDTVLALTAEYTHDELEKTTTLAGNKSEDYEIGLNLSKKLTTGTDVELDYNFLRHRTDSAFVQVNPSEESYIKFTFTQPLMKNILGINDWRDVKITRIDVNNFRSETLDKIEKSLSEVEKAYWQLMLIEQMVNIRKDAEEEAQLFYDIVKGKEELGSAELTDLYDAEANLKVRRAEHVVAKSNLRTAENELKLLMNNKEPDSSLRISTLDNLNISDEGILLVPALKAAFENRRDYKRAMNDIEAKDIKLLMKKNERWPQMDLEGSFKMNGVRRSFASSIEDVINETNTEYYAGVTFSYPLEGREAKSAYGKAQNEKAKALVNAKRVEKTIVTGIDTKIKKVNAYRQKVKEFLGVADLQLQKMREEAKKYRYGRSDSDRVTRFQQDYFNAEISLRQAKMEYIEALIDLYLGQNTYLERRDLVAK